MASNVKNEKRLNRVWEQYEDAQAYLVKEGLTTAIPEYVEFYEGNQWPSPTKNTRTMPRPTFNMVEMIVDTKIANVIGQPIKLNFVAEGETMKSSKFTKFAQYQMKEMGMNELNDRAAQDGGIKGTYVYHFYYDEKYAGKRGNYEGGYRCEIIDPLNILFADPTQTDEQKQKWIILVYRADVASVKAMADKGIDKNLIGPDDSESVYYEEEQDGTELCTLLLRYFRKGNEVYFERAVKGTIVNKPRPLNSELITDKQINEFLGIKSNDKEDMGEDTANISQPDAYLEKKEETTKEDIDQYHANLYPIVVGSWKKKDKSIYGRGEVVGLIPNQKAVNFEFAMLLLNHQELGWGKLLVKQNALDGQEPTNTPGEIITDNTPGTAWGITKLEGSGFSAGALNLAPQIVDLTRAVTNSSEIITGDMISKDLSGTAIAQLQAQAQKPYARLQKNFYRSQEKIGKILEQAYKLYYDEKEYMYDLTPDEQMMYGTSESSVLDTFNGKEFRDTKFEVVVEAGAGTQYSEIQSMNILNNLLATQLISLKDYAKLYPETGMPFKSELIAIEETKEKTAIVQLQQMVQQQAQQLEQYQNQTKQYDQVIKQLDGELKKTNSTMQGLQNEYASKITQQNEYIQQLVGAKKSPTIASGNKR